VNTADIKALDIAQANFGTADVIPVDINVVTSARTAELQFTASSVASSVTLEISGPRASRSSPSPAARPAVGDGVRGQPHQRRDRRAGGAAQLRRRSPRAGLPEHRLRFARTSSRCTPRAGTSPTQDAGRRAHRPLRRRDAVATVNGALTVGDGLSLKLNTTTLDMNLTLDKTFGAGRSSSRSPGRALFQLGPQVTSTSR
jgi:hypothetical protein